MKLSKTSSKQLLLLLVLAVSVLITQSPALAHCDSVDGPIVPAALKALEDGDPEPILRWVTADHEGAVREAFDRALEVRELGGEARELAELWFLETLIRLHREGEGAPYTGLKPAGSIEPIYLEADAALVEGDVQPLSDELSDSVREQIELRFHRALEARAHAEDSVEAGRSYVAAYVEYMHFVERLGSLLKHDEGMKPAEAGHVHGR